MSESQVTIRRTPDRAGDLVGAVEASEILGVERTRIARYVKTGVMPEPVAKLRATSVWLRADVEELKAERAAKKAGTASSRYRDRRAAERIRRAFQSENHFERG